MQSKPHPSQEQLQALYEYDGKTPYVISDLICLGGLLRRSGRTRRDHCFIGVKNHKLGYLAAYVPGWKGLFSLHRLVWIYHNGDIPQELNVDHRDHTPWHNRIQNLRLATVAQNQQNRFSKRAGAAGKTIGVIPRGKGFAAFVSLNGKPIYLGTWSVEAAAIEARRVVASKIYGEFFNVAART